jgi:WD40 repeat protein
MNEPCDPAFPLMRFVLTIACRFKHFPLRSTDIGTLLQELESNSDVEHRSFMEANRDRDPRTYPLKLALPPLASPSLLDRVQNKPDAEGTLRQLRKQRLKERGDAVYIQPQAKVSVQASDDDRFPLMEKVNEFLESNQRVFLLLGDSGAGKSTFNLQLEYDLWGKYKKATGRIPLHISLPSIEKPEQDMIAKQLRKAEFTESEIRELKAHREFILICDGYDESQLTHNLYMSNRLNQPGEWRAQMVISCRSEYIGIDYRDRFQPGDRNHRSGPGQFQEAVVTPFMPDQIHDYIKQYVLIHQPLWEVKDYEQALDHIPNLKDLVKNPFLMSLSLEVLPRMMDPGEHLSTTRFTRVELYDQFIEHWLERGKKRLSEKELSPQAKAAFESLVDEGFTQNGVDFLKKLAVAIYKEQGGQPIVKYSRFKDEGTWKAAFFSRDEEKQLLRDACPLTRSGNQHRFVHRSLLEHGLALAVYDPYDWRERESPIPGPGRRGSTDSAFSFHVHGSVNEVIAPVEQGLDLNSPVMWRYFINESSILQFLSERVQQAPIFKQQLHDYIEYSKTDEKWRTAAANAITILVRAGVQFNHANLRGIRIPGADLSYGVFESAQLQDADLRQVNLRGTWLRQADLSGSQMAAVQFGELPYLKEEHTIWSCAYSPDGSSLALSLNSGQIKVYSTSSWELARTLTGHYGKIRKIAYSPKGDRIVSGGRDCSVRLWDTEAESCIHTLTDHRRDVNCVAYSPQGDTIASSSDDGSVRVWDEGTGDCRMTLTGHAGMVWCITYSPNGHRIASGGGDNTVRLWDIETGVCLHIMSGHEDVIWGISYSPQGDRTASSSGDGTVRLWDVETGACSRVLTGHGGDINTVAYSLQGDVIASAGSDKTVRLWDADTGACRQVLTGHSSGVRCVAFSPKGDHIACGSQDNTVRLWDVGSTGTRQLPIGHSEGVFSIEYMPQGDQVFSSGNDGVIKLWDVETGVCRRVLEELTGRGHIIACSLRCDRLASASSRSMKLWDVKSGACYQTLTGHDSSIEAIAYSPRGNQVASGDCDGSVRIWDTKTGQCGHILFGHTSRVTNIVYSPKGIQVAAIGYDHTIHLWNTESGDSLHVLNGHRGVVRSIVYSPRGDLLASVSDDKTMILWAVESGDCRYILLGHTKSIQIVVFSPQSHQVASGDQSGTIRLWDVVKGECLHTFTDHTGSITSIVYSPKGDQIVSGSEDKTARLWDATSGQCRAVIQNLNSSIRSIAWSPMPDINCFISGCDDGSVCMWKVVDDEGPCRIRWCWRSVNGELVVTDTMIRGVRGLSQLNKQLLKQRGAVGEPFVRERGEVSKVISMVSVVSAFKQTAGETRQDSETSGHLPTGQLEQQEE